MFFVEEKMVKSGNVIVAVVNGKISAACGCGGHNRKDYLFFGEKKTVSVSPQIGGTVEKKHEVTRVKRHHHTKRDLRKHHRDTVRGWVH